LRRSIGLEKITEGETLHLIPETFDGEGIPLCILIYIILCLCGIDFAFQEDLSAGVR
jgi:hypothetical protein